jgi:hypothetical protein
MTGLQPFIMAMIRAPRARLATADHDKLAAKYEIPADWARFYLEHWRNT